jgi:hypothetical protein
MTLEEMRPIIETACAPLGEEIKRIRAEKEQLKHRVKELESHIPVAALTQLANQMEEIDRLTAILERVQHNVQCYEAPRNDCPRCAYEQWKKENTK